VILAGGTSLRRVGGLKGTGARPVLALADSTFLARGAGAHTRLEAHGVVINAKCEGGTNRDAIYFDLCEKGLDAFFNVPVFSRAVTTTDGPGARQNRTSHDFDPPSCDVTI
jgi:hypothetical protein